MSNPPRRAGELITIKSDILADKQNMASRKPILLIEDDQDYVGLVREVLASSEVFELRAVSSLARGLAFIDQYAPELIMLDLNLPDSSGYETFLRVRERGAGIPIVVLTALDEDEVAIRAVEDGAQDYLVKSLIQPNLIARHLSMALMREHRQASRMPTPLSAPGTVLSFIGSKGGVGTSTTAINVAALLANNRLETIVMELQLGRSGTLSLYLPSEPPYGLNYLLKQPAESITLPDLQHALVEVVTGLHLLCPTTAFGSWRRLDAEHVQALISVAKRAYRFVVLDLPARIDEGVAQALKLSDAVTLVMDRELASLHCGSAFVQQIRTATSRTKEVRLALVDRTDIEIPAKLADIKREFAAHPLVTVPHSSRAIAGSHSAKTPLVVLDPDDPFTLAHLELTEQLLPCAAGYSSSAGQIVLKRQSAWRPIPETMYG